VLWVAPREGGGSERSSTRIHLKRIEAWVCMKSLRSARERGDERERVGRGLKGCAFAAVFTGLTDKILSGAPRLQVLHNHTHRVTVVKQALCCIVRRKGVPFAPSAMLLIALPSGVARTGLNSIQATI
jgi:hypothetical protein